MANRPLQTRAEQVYEKLREGIVSGGYPPGTHLRLKALAAQLGTSVIPIRDALAELLHDGLVEGGRNRGWRVPEYDAKRLDELMELRVALECESARLCAERATRQELEELMFLGTQVNKAQQDEKVRLRLDTRFHRRLVQLAGNETILKTIERAHVLQLTFGSDFASRLRLPRYRILSHRKLVQAIMKSDPDMAEQAMRDHLGRKLKFAARAMAKGSGEKRA